MKLMQLGNKPAYFYDDLLVHSDIAKQAAGRPDIIVEKATSEETVPSSKWPTWLGSANWAKKIFEPQRIVWPATTSST